MKTSSCRRVARLPLLGYLCWGPAAEFSLLLWLLSGWEQVMGLAWCKAGQSCAAGGAVWPWGQISDCLPDCPTPLELSLTCISSLNVLLGSYSGKPLQHAKLCVGLFLSISWLLSRTFPFSCRGGRAEHLYVSQPYEWQLPPPSVAIVSIDLCLSVGSCAVNPLSY